QHRRALRERLDEHPAPPAGDVEAVHEHGEALPKLAQPAPALEQEVVEAGVEIEQEAPQPAPPFTAVGIGEELAQCRLMLGGAAPGWSAKENAPDRGGFHPSATFRPRLGALLWPQGHRVDGKRGKFRDLPGFSCSGGAGRRDLMGWLRCGPATVVKVSPSTVR